VSDNLGDLDGSQHGNNSRASGGNITINGGVVAYIALALVLVQTMFILALWNRYDLLRIYYNDIRTELIARGMNPHPHMPSESP
jgi:hypothetical protein